MVRFLTLCGQGDLAPLLFLLLFVTAYRYYTMRNICQAPSLPSYILEDAYGSMRQVSMDVLTDYSICREFRQAHYRNENRNVGAKLVATDSFHLMLGSQRGSAVGITNWTILVSKIQPGRRLVNVLYVESYDKACIVCKSTLIVTEYGEFH